MNHQLHRIRTDYDAAFARWSREVAALETSRSEPSSTPGVLEYMKWRVAEAEIAYRCARDRFTDALLRRGTQSDRNRALIVGNRWTRACA